RVRCARGNAESHRAVPPGSGPGPGGDGVPRTHRARAHRQVRLRGDAHSDAAVRCRGSVGRRVDERGLSMRILHILDHSLPLHSGYVFRTVSLLREQRARGWETIQLTTPRHTAPSTPVEEVEGWIFHRTEMAPKSWHRLPAVLYVDEMRATARRLDELIRRYKPDVVHAHSPVLNVLPAIRVARRHRIPVVYELRALWEDAAVDHGTTAEGSLRYRVSRALESYALHHVDHITTICEGLRHDITLRGVEPERITVIPNAVDPHAFQLGGTPDVTLRRRLGLEGATVLG